ncbi:MAG: hypothetical protein GY898_17930 [Proteobacteria bacterium]|nr:hypothetical protein [Pseudomonadota bacterium]
MNDGLLGGVGDTGEAVGGAVAQRLGGALGGLWDGLDFAGLAGGGGLHTVLVVGALALAVGVTSRLVSTVARVVFLGCAVAGIAMLAGADLDPATWLSHLPG